MTGQYGQQTWPGTYAPGYGFSGMGGGFGGQMPFGAGFGGNGFGWPGFGGPGFGGQVWGGPNFGMGGFGMGGFGQPGFGPMGRGYGLGGLRSWGGTYSPQFLTSGLPTDEELTEMIYDAIDDDPLIPFDADINVEVDAGTVTLSGTVPTKTIKHAAGDDTWWMPGVDDVHNMLQVVSRRGHREEAGPTTTTPRPTTTTPRPTTRERTGGTSRR
jgi:hypothetical protein